MKILVEKNIDFGNEEWVISLCDEEGCDSYCSSVCCDDSGCNQEGCHWF